MEGIPKSQAFKITLLSALISIFICGLKFWAYFLTKSVAIYSDALESIINIFSALLAMFGTKLALKPSDPEHPYGHTKIEYFISIIETLFIFLASFSILKKAIHSLIRPEALKEITTGLSFILITLFLNSFLSLTIYRIGKKEASPILVSHAAHIFTDALTTLGILLGILLAKIFNFWYLDPLLAILMSLNILYMGFLLLKDSVNSLLDVSISPKKKDNLKEIIQKTILNSPISSANIHEFKSRKAGRMDFIEFHLSVPKKTSVEEAHNLCDEIEKNIKKTYPEVSVTIHLEPDEKDDS